MITGFLFSSKLIDGKKSPIDWTRFVISRVLRLVPLYLVIVLFLLLIIGLLTNFTAQEPIFRMVKRVIQWIAFTVFENPDINEVQQTWMIVAGVTWTFAYEWLFYLSLPLIGPFFYRTNRHTIILLITSSLLLFIVFHVQLSLCVFYTICKWHDCIFLCSVPCLFYFCIKKNTHWKYCSMYGFYLFTFFLILLI